MGQGEFENLQMKAALFSSSLDIHSSSNISSANTEWGCLFVHLLIFNSNVYIFFYMKVHHENALFSPRRVPSLSLSLSKRRGGAIQAKGL